MADELKKRDFDLVTHKWDKKTRRLAEKNPYRMHNIKGVEYWERPVGSGNLFSKDGEPCGRLTNFKDLSIDRKAAHVSYEKPKSDAEIRDIKFNELHARNAELEAELSAIRKEKSYDSILAKAKVEQAAKKEQP